MTSGMILNTIICWLIFLAAFLTATNIFRHRKGKLYTSFALFWLLAGTLWFQVGLRQYFAWRGEFALDRSTFILDQILVFTHHLPIVFYIFYVIFRKKIVANILLAFFALISLFALYSFLIYGYSSIGITYFSTKHVPHIFTQIIFSSGFLILFLALLCTTLKKACQVIKRQTKNYSHLAALLSIVIYFIFGYFDQMGLFANWYLLIVRLFILTSVILAYFSYAHLASLKIQQEK